MNMKSNFSVCKICKKRFVPSKHSKGIYCSTKCAYSDKERMSNLPTKGSHRTFSKEHKENLRGPKTEEHKIKISDALKVVSKGKWAGDKNPKWKGGVAELRSLIRGTFNYRLWRSDVFKRDNYTCILCGDNKGHNLNADHYPKSFSDILDRNKIKSVIESQDCAELWDINNGRTLCINCHKKHHKNYNK